MIIEALFIGLIAGMIFYEITGISPAGVVAPGYLALYVHQPFKILLTIIIALLTWLVILFLQRYLLIYGRRRFLLALLVGFSLKIIIENYLQPSEIFRLDLEAIGYIIPGLIAGEFLRQDILVTLGGLGIVTASVYLILLII